MGKVDGGGRTGDIMTKSEVLLIDLSAIFRAAYHANENGVTTVAFQATLDGVSRAVGQRECVTAICCDGHGNWRKTLSPEYKAHREKQPESMYGLLDKVKARLKADGFLLWEFDGFEADDVIASARDAAIVAGHKVTVASHDKDLLQLVRPGVRFLKTSTWEEIGEETVLAKFGVTPSLLGDWLALTGDASDNVPGCPGCGPKTATALLQQFGTLEGVIKAAEDTKIPKLNPFWKSYMAIHAKLLASVEQVRLSRKLVELRYDVPLNFAELFEKRAVTRTTEGSIDMDAADDERFFGKKEQSAPQEVSVELSNATATDETPVTKVSPEERALPTVPTSVAVAPTQAIATIETRPFELQLEASNPTGAMNQARVLLESGLYPWCKNEATVFAIVLRGRELGLPAGVALDIFRPVKGRLCPSAHYIIDRCMTDPNCEYFKFVEGDMKSATYETKHRKSGITRLTYTMEEAQLTGLVRDDSAWAKYPAGQLRKTCGVFLGRIVYPGATLGLYAQEEMDQ